MFTLEVEYLLGRSYSGTAQDREEAEWPPHPARLFSALVASCYAGSFGEAGREALRWLEGQGEPLIRAGRASRPCRVQAFVPSNDELTAPSARKKSPRVFPSVSLEESRVRFVWPDADPTGGTRGVLERIAANVAYLGRAASLVRVSVHGSGTSNFSHVPDQAGETVLRVAVPGRLAELENAFARGHRPPSGAQRPYRVLARDEVEPPVLGVFDDMIVLRCVGGPRLPVEAGLSLTAIFRKAMIAKAESAQVLSGLIHGHDRSPHAAFAALPYIGYDHADGRIMGVAIILPADTTLRERREVLQVASTVKQINMGALGELLVDLADEAELPFTLRAATWSRPSRVWMTATPMLLDRFPKKPGKGPTVGEIIATSCLRAGFPRPSCVRYGHHSRLKGVPPVAQFNLRRTDDEAPRMAVHAEIEFDERVAGPLLLGAGRYFGLGLLRPGPDSEVRA